MVKKDNGTLRFKHYGKLEKIAEGDGILFLKKGDNRQVSFAIAKRGEEKLLFNIVYSTNNIIESFSQEGFDSLDKLEGVDKQGRQIIATGLLSKDSTSNLGTDSKVIINGYVDECKIGQVITKPGFSLQFDLMNFLFIGNETKVETRGKGKKSSRSILQLVFDDFSCRIEQTKDYSTITQLLKRQGGVFKTSTIIVEIDKSDDYEGSFEKVRKLCQLLSVARSTFINWGSCRIFDTKDEVVYEFHGQAQSRNYHGNNLIKDLPKETVKFLNTAWNEYDRYKELLDLKRVLYGYIDTFQNSYIETRCLNIAALTESVCSRWAIHEERDLFINEVEFQNQLPELKDEIEKVLNKVFTDLKDPYRQIMLNKVKGFNRRPLDWKLKRLRKAFSCPINDKEISRFVDLRDSLAHSSLFPEKTDNVNAFLFMRHFIDKIILRVLGYEGDYFNMEIRKEMKLTGIG